MDDTSQHDAILFRDDPSTGRSALPSINSHICCSQNTLRYIYNEFVWYVTTDGTFALPILCCIFCFVPLMVLWLFLTSNREWAMSSPIQRLNDKWHFLFFAIEENWVSFILKIVWIVNTLMKQRLYIKISKIGVQNFSFRYMNSMGTTLRSWTSFCLYAVLFHVVL